MLVSIIVPIYNSEKTLKKLLKSLIEQTYKNIEIILINDGSSDSSLKICESFKVNDERIKIYTKENEGVSASRNMGLNIANGEYITFIDSDDYVDKNYIELLVNNIEKGCLVKCNYKKQEAGKIYTKLEYVQAIATGEILGVCWGYLFDKKILKDLKFDIKTSYMEDTIFLLQYIFRINTVKTIGENIYHHIPNLDGLTRSNKNIDRKINGYIYSLNKIQDLLENENINMNQQIIQIRKIKIIEAEIAKIENTEEIAMVIKNKNVQELRRYKNIPIKYYLFYKLVKSSNRKGLYIYIKIRKIIKNIIKG